jgi:hypothetical protein
MLGLSVLLGLTSGNLRVGGVIRHPHHTSTTVATSSGTIARSEVLVQVANGTKKLGLARFETQQLAAQGWNMLPGINGPRVGHTAIYYKAGYAESAAAIQKFLGSGSLLTLNGPSPVPGSANCHILVVVGPDLAN